MPTPVSTAKQCLTPEASHALEEAVAVARRRGHAQTTSLHAVSAFLFQPSSPLREACIRARNASFYPRDQFKALELSLSLTLDRLPSNSNQQHQPIDDPPISNSFMAAIKRSQANQRRQPESFCVKQHQQGVEQVGGGGGSIGTSGIKVELEHLIVSILDDPIVSRVFNEAGFSSFDIKLAIVRPIHSFFRYPPRLRRPQNMFFTNLDEISDSDSGVVPFRFPFSGSWGNSDREDNLRRIGQILVKKKGRNPLLIGVSSSDELRVFTEELELRKDDVLPSVIHGIHVIRVEKEILEIVRENRNEELICSMFEHVGMVAKQWLGPGVMVSLGDLKSFLSTDDEGVVVVDDVLKCVVNCLTKLLAVHGSRIWLIAAATHETYLKFVTRFPSIEMEWDLQLLPISSIKPAVPDSCFKPSLMGSFVPFGGFFSSPSDVAVSLSGSNQSARRCNVYKGKCEPKLAAGFGSSVADQYQTILPSWLQMSEHSPKHRFDVLKAKEDKVVLPTAVASVWRNWDTMCQHICHAQPSSRMNACGAPSGVKAAVDSQFSKVQNEMSDGWGSCSSRTPRKESDDIRVDPALSINSYKHSMEKLRSTFPLGSFPKNESFLDKMSESPAKTGLPLPGPCSSLICTLPLSSVDENQTSPTSGSTVTTDLGLGIFSQLTRQDKKKGAGLNTREVLHDTTGCWRSGSKHDTKFSDDLARSSNCSKPDIKGHTDPGNQKTLFETLIGRIGRQNEAVRLISQAVARCRTGKRRHRASVFRGDIWLYFLGPDASGKRKIAMALAEILYGGRDKFIYVDLCEEDWQIHFKKGSDRGSMSGREVVFHSKTVVDRIARELLFKTSLSVVFIENVHCADPLVQNSLLQAIRSGKFPDSYGREVSISNTTFVLTSRPIKSNTTFDTLENPSSLSEERIMKARGWPIQIIVKDLTVDHKQDHNSAIVTAKKGTPNPFFLNKRKLKRTDGASEMDPVKCPYKGTNVCLDLNIPAEEIEAGDTDTGSIHKESISRNPASWLDDLVAQVDETVVFEPFDYNALAEDVSKLLMESFGKIFSSQSVLEIDLRVMDQITAVAALSEQEDEVEDWVEQVLSKGFVEARKRYFLGAHTAVKLDTCQPLYVEDQAQGAYLPSKIILN